MGPVGGMARLGEIPLNAYYPYKNIVPFILVGELARSVGSRYKATEIPATGIDRLAPHQPTVPYEQPIPPTGMKNCHVYCDYTSRALGLHVRIFACQ